MKYCPECQDYYTPKGDWQKTCTKCWIATKEKKIWNEGYERGKAENQGAARVRHSPTHLSEEQLLQLIALCHPDRHPPERYAQANSATAWLNAFRDEKFRDDY